MNKVPFHIVEIFVNKMYDQMMSSNDESKINIIISNIVKFLHRCGWTEEQYTSYMMGYDQFN